MVASINQFIRIIIRQYHLNRIKDLFSTRRNDNAFYPPPAALRSRNRNIFHPKPTSTASSLPPLTAQAQTRQTPSSQALAILRGEG